MPVSAITPVLVTVTAPVEALTEIPVEETKDVTPVAAGAAQYGVKPVPDDVKMLPAVPADIFPNDIDEDA